MCGEFGEVTVIIGLVINFLAFVSLLFAFRDTSTYGLYARKHNVVEMREDITDAGRQTTNIKDRAI